MRQPRLVFAMAQWLWAMRGSAEVERIAHYNDRGRAFSDDGQLLNAAIGARIRRPVDQLEAVLTLLRRDPTSRRAQLVLARPQDVLADSRDSSCFSVAQVFVNACLRRRTGGRACVLVGHAATSR
jgi:thymidylate synthase